MDPTKTAIFFDWSGTLSDDIYPVFVANNLVLESYGAKKCQYQEWLDFCCGNASEFLLKFGIKDSAESIQQKYEKAFTKTTNELNIRPTIYHFSKDCLVALKEKGVTLIVISAHPQDALEREAKEYKIQDLFQYIIGSAFDKAKIIEEYSKKMNFAPENVVYVGDTVQDVRASKKAGVMSIAVYGGYHKKEMLEKENPDRLFENASKLTSLFGSQPECDL